MTWRWVVRQGTIREGWQCPSITVDAPGVGVFLSSHNKIHDREREREKDLIVCLFNYCCLLLIDKARGKDKTYIYDCRSDERLKPELLFIMNRESES